MPGYQKNLCAEVTIHGSSCLHWRKVEDMYKSKLLRIFSLFLEALASVHGIGIFGPPSIDIAFGVGVGVAGIGLDDSQTSRVERRASRLIRHCLKVHGTSIMRTGIFSSVTFRMLASCKARRTKIKTTFQLQFVARILLK